MTRSAAPPKLPGSVGCRGHTAAQTVRIDREARPHVGAVVTHQMRQIADALRTGCVSEHNLRLIMGENVVRMLAETLPD